MSSPQLLVFVDEYLGLEFFVRFGSLTRPKFEMAEYLFAKSSNTKVLSENHTCQRKINYKYK